MCEVVLQEDSVKQGREEDAMVIYKVKWMFLLFLLLKTNIVAPQVFWDQSMFTSKEDATYYQLRPYKQSLSFKKIASIHFT